MLDQLTANISELGQTPLTSYLEPLIIAASVLAGLVASLFIGLAGFEYITSRGQPHRLGRAKQRLSQALLGLILVLGAGTLVSLLVNTYPPANEVASQVTSWSIEATPLPEDDDLLGIVLGLAIGFLEHLVLSVAQPLINVLNEFSQATPLMRDTPIVGQLWLVVLALSQILLVGILVIFGFGVMTGLSQFDTRELIGRLILCFLAANLSLVLVDSLISLSNVMIASLTTGTTGTASLWQSLSQLAGSSGEAGLAALLLTSLVLILSLGLAIYYLSRWVVLALGAILSPLVILLSLLPAWRSFCRAAVRQYLLTVFILFIHNIILLLAGGLLLSFADQGLVVLLLALATLWALLKTPSTVSRLGQVGLTSGWRDVRSQLVASTSQTISQLRSFGQRT